ncbi:hypothetical protein POD33_34980 [Streptomyces moderatus]|nr:hypothetical protein POD33_34980 [Streptomyces moderatus]
MRDEVFRVPGGPGRRRPRDIELDGELWFLLVDVVIIRGHQRQLARLPELLDQIPEDEREMAWILEPGLTAPRPMWVVSEQGRIAAQGALDVRARRPRRRKATPGSSATRAAGVEGAIAKPE